MQRDPGISSSYCVVSPSGWSQIPIPSNRLLDNLDVVASPPPAGPPNMSHPPGRVWLREHAQIDGGGNLSSPTDATAQGRAALHQDSD
jgi:hypothetical protein